MHIFVLHAVESPGESHCIVGLFKHRQRAQQLADAANEYAKLYPKETIYKLDEFGGNVIDYDAEVAATQAWVADHPLVNYLESFTLSMYNKFSVTEDTVIEDEPIG